MHRSVHTRLHVSFRILYYRVVFIVLSLDLLLYIYCYTTHSLFSNRSKSYPMLVHDAEERRRGASPFESLIPGGGGNSMKSTGQNIWVEKGCGSDVKENDRFGARVQVPTQHQ